MCLFVVEDDMDLNCQFVIVLEEVGYVVDSVFDGEEGYFFGDIEFYDVVVLDFGFLIFDGLFVLENWCCDGCIMLVLILIVWDCWLDKVVGIDVGVDDYVVKLFYMEEVFVCVWVLVCWVVGYVFNELICGLIWFDLWVGWVIVDGVVVKLIFYEYWLFFYLFYYQGKVIFWIELMEYLYDQDFDWDFNIVEVFVGWLCKKVGFDMIEIICGFGYCLGDVSDG